jgi:spermidine dehydrogenase
MDDPRDRELGMKANITRRDFLNGAALVVGAAIVPDALGSILDGSALAQNTPGYYPPALTGLRGSTDASFQAAHQLRDDSFWQHAPKPIETGEEFDLIVVGGGISGLAAAHYFRQSAGPSARILILENHDDFGGHARRNEFHVNGRMLLGYGGTYSIESPEPYSPQAQALIRDLGIDVSSYSQYFDKELYPSLGLARHVFFDKETFGTDKAVVDPRSIANGEGEDDDIAKSALTRFLTNAPLSQKAKDDYVRLLHEKTDYLPGLSSTEKKLRLAKMSYAAFLTDLVKVDPQIVKLFQAGPHGLFGIGIDAVSAQDAWGLDLPGFAGMNLDPAPGRGMNRDAIPNEEAEKYFFHFPDGNATIARLLVRKLIPSAISGSTDLDVVTARANYARLDDPASPVRLRLNSTVVKVAHLAGSSAKKVEVSYFSGGRLYRAHAANCVLACWHVMIPYICPELPKEQQEALAYAVKVPLIYTNVVLKNWHAWQKMGVNYFYAPGSYYSGVSLDLPVSLGEYHFPQSPDDPIVVHMMRTPCSPGQPARVQHRTGRYELYDTSFETLERNTRDQLARMLAPGGFDPARDLAAITINRWPHGYAYEYNSLWDKFWLEGGVTPCEIARRPFGRIAIANSDAGAYAYTDSAIDQAYRAVNELVGSKSKSAGA